MKKLVLILFMVFVLGSVNVYSITLRLGSSGVVRDKVKVWVYDNATNRVIEGAQIEIETSIPPIIVKYTDQYGYVYVKFKRMKNEIPLIRVYYKGYVRYDKPLIRTVNKRIKIKLVGVKDFIKSKNKKKE